MSSFNTMLGYFADKAWGIVLFGTETKIVADSKWVSTTWDSLQCTLDKLPRSLCWNAGNAFVLPCWLYNSLKCIFTLDSFLVSNFRFHLCIQQCSDCIEQYRSIHKSGRFESSTGLVHFRADLYIYMCVCVTSTEVPPPPLFPTHTHTPLSGNLDQIGANILFERRNMWLKWMWVWVFVLQTVQQIQIKAPPPLAQQLGHNGAMECIWGPAIDIFQLLLADLDTEGRYLFLNAIANQLRYPNNHTHFFSFVLLYLFVEASQVRSLSLSLSHISFLLEL